MDAANRSRGETKSVERAAGGRDDGRRTAGSCGIAIMAKASAPGRTKTRLVPPLTFEQAAALNTAFLQDIAGNLLLARSYAAIAGYVAFAPAGSEAVFPRHLAVGHRLDRCVPAKFRRLLAAHRRGNIRPRPCLSGRPQFRQSDLAYCAAGRNRRRTGAPGERAVLGPSTDGGYYLLGLKTPHRRLFEEITWSTERVAAQTLERARELELEVHMLPSWYDVDDAEGLRRLHGEMGAARAAANG